MRGVVFWGIGIGWGLRATHGGGGIEFRGRVLVWGLKKGMVGVNNVQEGTVVGNWDEVY